MTNSSNSYLSDINWPLLATAVTGTVLTAVIIHWLTTGDKSGQSNNKKKATMISTDTYSTFPLVKKTIISPNTASYRFALPDPEAVLGLPIGQHISLCAKMEDGKDVVRSYTPTSRASDRGGFDVLIKTYPNGKLSSYIANMKIGDSILVKGPKGQFKYSVGCASSIGMIAGGTGITPMYQIIQAVLDNPDDKTNLSLIFANNAEEDILLREQLDAWAASDSRFKVTYVLFTPSNEWKGYRGFVTRDIIAKHLPAYAEGVKLLLCGPPPMVKAMSATAVDLGFPAPNVISKMEDAVFKF